MMSLEFDNSKNTFHSNFILKIWALSNISYIEVVESAFGIVIDQRKYALNILTETTMLDYRPCDTPMYPNIKLLPGQGEPLKDPKRYRRLVGKLNYLTITRLDITFAVSVVSQFLNAPCDSHWDAMTRILRCIKKDSRTKIII